MKKKLNKSWSFQSILKFSFIKQMVLFTTLIIGIGGFNQAMAFVNDSTDDNQQQQGITGIVVDSDGNPVPGVTVYIKGTTIGTITDFDGNYTLPAQTEGAVIVFSFVGKVTQEIPIEGKTRISVTLQDDSE